MTRPETTRLRELLADAMQNAWNDFCADTGNWPDCFIREGRQVRADFGMGNYAQMVSNEFRRLIGDEHIAVFTEDGWSLEHTIECRLGGAMSDCAYHRAVERYAEAPSPEVIGRYRITLTGGDVSLESLASASGEST